jgi:hypothetical protein
MQNRFTAGIDPASFFRIAFSNLLSRNTKILNLYFSILLFGIAPKSNKKG